MAYNTSEINRLQRAIADRAAQLEKCYALLGKQYVERHRTESDNEFSMLISTISEHESTIKVFGDQILALRGYQRCTGCGAEIPLTSCFCNACGAKVPDPPAGQIRCPSCGRLLPADARFCNGCGTPVAPVSPPYAPPAPAPAPVPVSVPESVPAPAPVPAPEPVPVPDPEPEFVPAPVPDPEPEFAPAPVPDPEPEFVPVPDSEPAPASVRICPNCGSAVDADCLFCTECGTKL